LGAGDAVFPKMPNAGKWLINYDFVGVLLWFFDIIRARGFAGLYFRLRND
jgi:hypothetical protein